MGELEEKVDVTQKRKEMTQTVFLKLTGIKDT